MDELVSTLAQLRYDLARVKDEQSELQCVIEETFGALIESLAKKRKDLEVKVENTETEVRSTASALHRQGKAIHPALGIRRSTILSYDPDAALNFCLNNMRTLVSFDKRKFESHARKIDLDFVSKEPGFSVTIKSDLSKWRDKDEESD